MTCKTNWNTCLCIQLHHKRSKPTFIVMPAASSEEISVFSKVVCTFVTSPQVSTEQCTSYHLFRHNAL